MKKELVEVVFDRRKNSEKRGYGFLEVQVYLGRATRKYITEVSHPSIIRE